MGLLRDFCGDTPANTISSKPKAKKLKRYPLADLLTLSMDELADWLLENHNKYDLVRKER